MDLCKQENISAEIVDLRSLVPLDEDTIYDAVKKCGKVLVLHEDTLFGGISGEIVALINEHCFEHLDAPVRRLAALDTPVPFVKQLEDAFLPKGKLKEVLQELLEY